MNIFLSQHFNLKQIGEMADDEVIQQRNTDTGSSVMFSPITSECCCNTQFSLLKSSRTLSKVIYY